MYVRKVLCGCFNICEASVTETFTRTPYDEWIWIRDPRVYTVRAEGIERNVRVCELISYDEVLILSKVPVPPFDDPPGTHVPEIEIIDARCVPSMHFLDMKHRAYVNTLTLGRGDILAIKSVAGSGKTTTLLKLAAIHADKRILYLAFNKSLIEDIKQRAPPNLIPKTFDSLLYGTMDPRPGHITDLKPFSISKLVPWLANKPYKMKEKYAYAFDNFCNQVRDDTMEAFALRTFNKPEKILQKLWEDATARTFYTFGSIRKMCQVRHLCRGHIDKAYDMIFIDESQDFDLLMLSILLNDTTVPKIFVGDPMQAIYQWRGAINAFDRLPKQTKVIEFYTTFRIGEPACSEIRGKFDTCWMIPGRVHETSIVMDGTPETKYTYLFRSWKGLFQTARTIPNIWINNFDKQSTTMKNLSEKLSKYKLTDDEKAAFSDDLPQFLLSLRKGELDTMIHDIEQNLVTKDACTCEMHTIHSYKGLEDDIVKIHGDVDFKSDMNLRYVALTRGKSMIIESATTCTHQKERR